MSIEDDIRRLARQGHSRRSAAKVLGISVWKLRTFADNMQGVRWPAMGHSVDNRRSRERLRGVCTPSKRAQLMAAAAKRLEKLAEQHEAFGVKGNLCELCRRFGVVGRSTLEKRLRRGWHIERALTEPPLPPGVKTV